MTARWQSAIYEGRVAHRRRVPVRHEFDYPIYLMYVDLDELPELFRDRWLWSADRPAPAWFRRADYLGPREQPLREAVTDLVRSRTGTEPAGPIRLLTQLRIFGLCFNPVSFYYCFDATGERVETIVAEITNTPWGERHAYVLGDDANVGRGKYRRHRFAKSFHVSPFMDMNLDYDWRFNTPGESVFVRMENQREGRPFFEAELRLQRREITGGSLARVLARYPAMSARTVLAIYWQAARLWRKRCPFFVHPRKREISDERTRHPSVA